MSGPSKYTPKSPFARWLERRLPILSFMHDSFVAYPTPKNLNYMWTFGAILSFMLIAQIVTGIVLAMHYTPETTLAFDSIEHIMRDVNWGMFLRYAHANGASMFFLAVYLHIFRGMYYGSYKEPRELLWILGIVIFLAMMATGFLGYVLPWGQMSFWAATVITNLFSAIPVVGNSITTWLLGGYSVDNPTLNRFYALHYLLPFVLVAIVALHVWALHVTGQNNPTGVEVKDEEKETVPFTPYATLKDAFGIGVFLVLLRLADLLRAQLPWPSRQLHRSQSAGDAGAYRARVVFPALLRDPARDPEQAARRHRPVLGGDYPGGLALARLFEGEVGALSALVRQGVLGLRRGRRRPRLSRLPAGGRRLSDRGAGADGLLFLPLPRAFARAGQV